MIDDGLRRKPITLNADWIPRAVAGIFLIAVVLYLVAPILVAASISFTTQSYIQFPPRGFSLQWYQKYLSDPLWRQAMLNTAVVGLVCCVFATVVGTLTAYGISRIRRPFWRDALFVLFLTPLVVPYMALAMSLYPLYADLHLIGTRVGVGIAQAVVAIPYVVIAVTSAIRRRDANLEQAARTLGASPIKAFWHVVLPLLRPGIIGGAVLAFITSFDDVVMPIFLGGISAGTIPKAMLDALYGVSDPTVMAVSASINAAGLLLLLLALATTRRRSGS
jgi:ABC-type spermidine/putrescine transport system permease subunit II